MKYGFFSQWQLLSGCNLCLYCDTTTVTSPFFLGLFHRRENVSVQNDIFLVVGCVKKQETKSFQVKKQFLVQMAIYNLEAMTSFACTGTYRQLPLNGHQMAPFVLFK